MAGKGKRQRSGLKALYDQVVLSEAHFRRTGLGETTVPRVKVSGRELGARHLYPYITFFVTSVTE